MRASPSGRIGCEAVGVHAARVGDEAVSMRRDGGHRDAMGMRAVARDRMLMVSHRGDADVVAVRAVDRDLEIMGMRACG